MQIKYQIIDDPVHRSTNTEGTGQRMDIAVLGNPQEIAWFQEEFANFLRWCKINKKV